jgi:hypothetical protein
MKDRNEKIECKCGECGMIINRYDDRGRERQYVSGHNGRNQKLVFNEGKGNLVKCACGKCDVMIREFNDRGERRTHFLSHQSKNKTVHSGKDHWHYKTGKWKQDGYVYVKNPEHPRARKDGYILEHILVLEKKLGRYLTDNEHSHHINRIRDDNRPENLTVLTSSKHVIHHNKERWKKDKLKNKLNPPCPHCKSTDVRKEGHLYTKTEKKQKYYCVSCKRSFVSHYQIQRRGKKLIAGWMKG